MGDLIVVGAGAAGLSAAWAASLMGFSVVCLEARRIGHPAASSNGLVKILRYAYEDEKFSRLLVEAEELWRMLEEGTGVSLLRRCDGLNIGRSGSKRMASIVASLEATGRDYEVLRQGDSHLDRLGINLAPDERAVLEIGAAVIEPKAALAALSLAARASGVRIFEGVQARSIVESAAGLRVETGDRTFLADRVIVAAGPWVHDLVPEPPIPLSVTRQQQVIFATDKPIGDGRQLIWTDLVNDDGYGIVNTASGLHVVGSHAPGPAVNPAEITGHAADHDAAHVQALAFQRRLGAVRVEPVSSRICHYTSTADGDFVVTHCPGLPGTVLLSACSGHGFKFVVTTGLRAAELAAR
ncbi:FAD-dependent oxidoreductase [Phytohabitans sp. ZYX-F-186]|uniref:FAD-dependent oxidoreductase n=1 Tax=Phytohabitans maris TaxID=3071409 RepID=A0ABU0ZS29_9ACTN|nr:FAD-dependent oxidoreductase [Phytohabitans sp. ZYX-F-186]MDQ7909843.1 FAD-dependent oxidoreductase [Phytohabitans sp. ZYX-F-186]